VFKLLREALRTGDLTERYPFGPFEASPGFRGMMDYDPQYCITCAACTMVCPSNALGMHTDVEAGTRTWSFFLGQCIFCARCQEVCPTGAIELSPAFEMAVTRREDLYVTGTFRLAPCLSCGTPFISQKEVDYVLAQDVQMGLPPGGVEARREILQTCPRCKRHKDVVRVATRPHDQSLAEAAR
jgi:formate hydrogenlyase subunit 6/NADH:ubiquinone oxidoreductase subunit I